MTGHRVALAVTDGVPTFELGVPCEVFGLDRSDIVTPWYDFRLCAAEPGRLVTSAGLQVCTPYGLADLVEADTVLVPACSAAGRVAPPPALLEALRAAHARGARIASLCAGSYVLAAAGLLDGRRATTHWMNAADFAARFPRVTLDPTVLYVDEGDVITSAGTAAAIDLCLHLVRRDHGVAVANEVARRMVVPAHRGGERAQRVPATARPRPADALGPVLDWAQRRLAEPLTVAELARRAHQSPRTFARHFRDTTGTTPLQWLVEQRVRLAQELLETTDEPVERIARLAGFGDATSLRRHFTRLIGVSPTAYREAHLTRRPAFQTPTTFRGSAKQAMSASGSTSRISTSAS